MSGTKGSDPQIFEKAWGLRAAEIKAGAPVRIFHGPGEGTGSWSNVAIEKFEDYYWVYEWASGGPSKITELLKTIVPFLESKGAKGAVLLRRPEKGAPDFPSVILGSCPETLTVQEGRVKSLIRFEKTRHPGLFLDHAPLRRWLGKNAQGRKVLNTFCYTGSLSVAAALGGATEVVNLDLSKPTLKWSEENWVLNDLPREKLKIWADDYFVALPRAVRRGDRFDCVILDPPSFSRGEKGTFSTSKDLEKLHRLAIHALAPGGFLISSINSENVSIEEFDEQVDAAIAESGRRFKKLQAITQADSFPGVKYLKGWIYRSD